MFPTRQRSPDPHRIELAVNRNSKLSIVSQRTPTCRPIESWKLITNQPERGLPGTRSSISPRLHGRGSDQTQAADPLATFDNATAEKIAEVLDRYCHRGAVELFFKTLTSGLKIEDMKIEDMKIETLPSPHSMKPHPRLRVDTKTTSSRHGNERFGFIRPKRAWRPGRGFLKV